MICNLLKPIITTLAVTFTVKITINAIKIGPARFSQTRRPNPRAFYTCNMGHDLRWATVVTYLFAGEHPLSTMRLTPTLLTVIAIITCSFCDFGDYTSDNVKTHRQVLSLDTSAVYEGVLKPENIAIHVAQNFVNFVSSTLAWSFLLHLYQVDLHFKKLSINMTRVRPNIGLFKFGRSRTFQN